MSENMLNHLCLGCMRYLDHPDEPCPACGWHSQLQNQHHQLAAGSFLAGKYLIGRTLGEGGFGITYLGWDIGRSVKVAIKEYYPSDSVSRHADHYTLVPRTGQGVEQLFHQGRDKFFSEAQSLARFDAVPGIVRVYDFFQENDTAYIVMEFIEGQTLRQYLESLGRPMLLGDVLLLLAPVVDSLEQVHDKGLIHRDISPDNIMIDENGGAKLLDFGAARAFSLQGERSNTINVKMGYAPEEQYLTHGKQGPWTDVYALAATIYRAITGTVPVQALDRTRTDILSRPSDLGAAINPQQEAVLMKGMAIYARNRYQSVGEFYKALRNAKDGGFGGGGTLPPRPVKNRAKDLARDLKAVLSKQDPDGSALENVELCLGLLLCIVAAILCTLFCLAAIDGAGFAITLEFYWMDIISLACLIALMEELLSWMNRGVVRFSHTVHTALLGVHLLMCLIMLTDIYGMEKYYSLFFLAAVPGSVLGFLGLNKASKSQSIR